jgi:type IV secretory pathway TrbD component
MKQNESPALYFKSLNRPILIMGVDRSLFFLLMALCLPVAFSGHFQWLMDLIAILIFSCGYSISLLLTRADPNFIAIYRRFVRYAPYYTCQPGIQGWL